MNHSATPRNWLCYYGLEEGPESYARFDLVVLDGKYHPPLARDGKGRPTILGYVSLAEVEEGGHLWPLVKDRPFLIRKNPLWNSWVIDVRDRVWQGLLLDKIIPEILDQGFDGLMLDTADSALDLRRTDEAGKYEGTRAGLTSLIRRISGSCPGIRIALNRGLEILPRVAGVIDYLIVENLYSHYAGPGRGYRRVDIRTQTLLLEMIRQGLKNKPDLSILTLDYAAPAQGPLIREAITFSRERGFIPYVGTRLLHRIHRHTLGG